MTLLVLELLPLLALLGGALACDWRPSDPVRRQRGELARDVASARGWSRVRGRVRALRTVATPWDGSPVAAYAMRVRRSRACACIASCPHSPKVTVFERDAGAIAIEDATGVLWLEGEVALLRHGARTAIADGDLVEVVGWVEPSSDPRHVEAALDRVRRPALRIGDPEHRPLVLERVPPR